MSRNQNIRQSPAPSNANVDNENLACYENTPRQMSANYQGVGEPRRVYNGPNPNEQASKSFLAVPSQGRMRRNNTENDIDNDPRMPITSTQKSLTRGTKILLPETFTHQRIQQAAIQNTNSRAYAVPQRNANTDALPYTLQDFINRPPGQRQSLPQRHQLERQQQPPRSAGPSVSNRISARSGDQEECPVHEGEQEENEQPGLPTAAEIANIPIHTTPHRRIPALGRPARMGTPQIRRQMATPSTEFQSNRYKQSLPLRYHSNVSASVPATFTLIQRNVSNYSIASATTMTSSPSQSSPEQSTPGQSTPGYSTPGHSTPGHSTPGTSTSERATPVPRSALPRSGSRSHSVDAYRGHAQPMPPRAGSLPDDIGHPRRMPSTNRVIQHTITQRTTSRTLINAIKAPCPNREGSNLMQPPNAVNIPIIITSATPACPQGQREGEYGTPMDGPQAAVRPMAYLPPESAQQGTSRSVGSYPFLEKAAKAGQRPRAYSTPVDEPQTAARPLAYSTPGDGTQGAPGPIAYSTPADMPQAAPPQSAHQQMIAAQQVPCATQDVYSLEQYQQPNMIRINCEAHIQRNELCPQGGAAAAGQTQVSDSNQNQLPYAGQCNQSQYSSQNRQQYPPQQQTLPCPPSSPQSQQQSYGVSGQSTLCTSQQNRQQQQQTYSFQSQPCSNAQVQLQIYADQSQPLPSPTPQDQQQSYAAQRQSPPCSPQSQQTSPYLPPCPPHCLQTPPCPPQSQRRRQQTFTPPSKKRVINLDSDDQPSTSRQAALRTQARQNEMQQQQQVQQATNPCLTGNGGADDSITSNANVFRTLVQKLSSTFDYISHLMSPTRYHNAAAICQQAQQPADIASAAGAAHPCPVDVSCKRTLKAYGVHNLYSTNQAEDVSDSIRDCANAKKCGRVQFDKIDKCTGAAKISPIYEQQVNNLVKDSYCPGIMQETIDGDEDFNNIAFKIALGNCPMNLNDVGSIPEVEPLSLIEAFGLRIQMEREGCSRHASSDAAKANLVLQVQKYFTEIKHNPSHLNRSIYHLLTAEAIIQKEQREENEKIVFEADVQKVVTGYPDKPNIKIIGYTGTTKVTPI